MIYAPVIIPTLCRAEKLINCIESLQNNPYAEYTELYISLDYPPSEKYTSGHQKIKQYLQQGIEGFANVIIYEQTSNLGWQGNYFFLREKVYEKYDCYIYTEDDNVFSPDFLEYMDKCLTKYKENDDVVAITGYSYPIDWKTEKYNTLMIQNYFAAWGYGIWREKEEKMFQMLTLEYFEKQLYDIKAMKRLYHMSKNQYCNFIKGMIGYTNMLIDGEKILKVDLAFAFYQLFCNKYMVFPVQSKVRNTGYGQEGVHCGDIVIQEGKEFNHRHYPYNEQPIDEEERFSEITICPKELAECWNEPMSQFFVVSKRELLISVLSQIMCKIFGRKIMYTICRKFRKV